MPLCCIEVVALGSPVGIIVPPCGSAPASPVIVLGIYGTLNNSQFRDIKITSGATCLATSTICGTKVENFDCVKACAKVNSGLLVSGDTLADSGAWSGNSSEKSRCHHYILVTIDFEHLIFTSSECHYRCRRKTRGLCYIISTCTSSERK